MNGERVGLFAGMRASIQTRRSQPGTPGSPLPVSLPPNSQNMIKRRERPVGGPWNIARLASVME
jgi:hypothetical protein